MERSPGPDYRRYLRLNSETAILENLRPPSRTFLMFLMGLSAILIFYTISYGTIAGTYLPDTPPFYTIFYGSIAGT